MLYDNLFGPLGRIVLIGIGAGTLFLTFVVLLCFFTPGCLAYECMRRRTKTDDKSTPLHFNGPANDNMKLGDVSYRSWRLGSLYENGSICEHNESQRDSFNSSNAQFETMDTASTLNLIKAEEQKTENRLRDFPTELTMSLQYLPPLDGNISGKFVIGIEAVSNLPPKHYNCTLEPYVALNIVKQSWTNRKKIKLHSFRTRGIRHTASPIYRETFVVADVVSREVKIRFISQLLKNSMALWTLHTFHFALTLINTKDIGLTHSWQGRVKLRPGEWILDIAAYDHDRYANHTELSHLRVPIKEVKKVLYSPEIHLFNYKMKPSNREYGNILLGISYLPTAQRLTINVMKLRDLKFVPTVKSIQEFNPYVRVLMLNGKTGRKMKKKKTNFLRATAQPEFNETLTFDLLHNQLDTVQFLIVLCSKTNIEEAGNTDHPSDSEDSVHSYRKSKDVFIGKVALGKGVKGTEEKLHWFSIFQNPRKLVTVWHTLK